MATFTINTIKFIQPTLYGFYCLHKHRIFVKNKSTITNQPIDY